MVTIVLLLQPSLLLPNRLWLSKGRGVVDGYVVGATVFYDENNNGILDDSESGYVGVTDADGNFQLPDFSAADQGGSVVVVLPGEWIRAGGIRLVPCRLMFQKTLMAIQFLAM